MMISQFVSVLTAAVVLAALPAKAQLSPRQLFYDDGKKASPAKKLPEVEPTAVNPAPPKKQVTPPRIKPAPKKVEEPERAKRIPPMERKEAGQMLNAQLTPLVLRYSILKMVDSEQWLEVDADSRFQTGDRIQIQADGNQNGYLYILAQGTSGTWQTLFPNKDVARGDNRVQPYQSVRYPSENKTFSFTGKPGIEKILIVYSRNPDTDTDKLMYQDNPTSGNRTMLASNASSIQNSEVERLKVRSRDLIIEVIKEKDEASSQPKAAAAARKKESAVYVATKDLSLNANVIAEIRLRHE